jgi:deoxyribonucleoside regulator
MAERGTGEARAIPAGADTELLVDLATRFYVEGQTQAAIARAVGVDPSTISRLLQRARDEGIVRVEIVRPQTLEHELATGLAEAFSLKRALVVSEDQRPGGGGAVARAAADYVNSRFLTGTRVAVSWGRMLSAAIYRLPAPGSVSNLEVSLLHGGVDEGGAGIQGHELARHLALVYAGSRLQYLHAPVLVDSPDIKQSLLRDSSIRAALESAAASDIALVGIGTLDQSAPLIRFGHLSRSDRNLLLKAGAVGDTATRFFTVEGEPVHALDDRLIAVEWSALEGLPLVVAMAAGNDKRDAVLGALRSGLLDVLVTDAPTAREVLRVAHET